MKIIERSEPEHATEIAIGYYRGVMHTCMLTIECLWCFGMQLKSPAVRPIKMITWKYGTGSMRS